MMSPWNSSGVETSTFIMGSSKIGPDFLHRVLDGEDGRELERQFVGIDFMVRAVGDVDRDVDDGRAVDHAVEERFFDALLDRRE